MTQNYRFTFSLALGLIFLTPLFFVPGGALYVESAKALLFSFGIMLMTLSYIFESFRQGSFHFPKHHLLTAVILLPVVYLLSSSLSTPSSLSFLGYSLEVGTFGYVLLGSTALLVFSAINVGTARALQALVALFASLTVLALFVALKVLVGGDFLALGNFFTNMGNPLGSWTDLAIAFSLLTILSTLVLGMIPVKPLVKVFLYGVFLISLSLLVIVGFSTAFLITLGASVVLFLYLSRVENHFHLSGTHTKLAHSTILPIMLGLTALLFVINPMISKTRGTLSNVVSQAFRIENTDVRPSLSATLNISKAVLSQVALLGSGPNTFSHDWLIFRPVDVNSTAFWSVSFPFGIGFLATQIATTGILGTALWLAFLLLLLAVSIKVLSHLPESRANRFTLVSTLFTSLFLWVSALLYAPSGATLMIAFLFTGLLLALMKEEGMLADYKVDLQEATPARLVSFFVMVVVVMGAISIGWIGVEKTLAAYHFKKANDLANVAGTSLQKVESELDKAVTYDPIDTYYVAISRLNFNKAQTASNSATGTPEQNQKVFQDGVSKAISSARSAVSVNPASYTNWVNLGLIYSSLVPEPLKVEGAYDNARFAFGEAVKRNPNNPELPLFLAQLEINNKNADGARSYIRNAIALKEDYADAYLLLAQLEVREKNITGAIQSAGALAVLVPENAGIHFELGVLKFSNKDYEGAVDSLEKAVKLVSDYANAKYYLALAYAQLGRVDEARMQLEDLLVANPDSQELKDALKTLNAGKKP